MTEPDDPDPHLDFRTSIPQWIWDEFYSAFGRFMHEFATFENGLNIIVGALVRRFVGTKGKNGFLVLKAILAGQRIAASRDTLTRLIKITTPGYPWAMDEKAVEVRDKELTEILNHVGEISYLRNRIAHNGAVPDMTNKDNWFYTSNDYSNRDMYDSDQLYFKSSMLVAAAEDLKRVSYRLDLILNKNFNDERRERNPEIYSSPAWIEYEENLLGPWQYKASELKRVGAKTLRSRGGQKPLRR